MSNLRQQAAWHSAFTKGSKQVQKNLAKIHANNPEFQNFVKQHGFGGNLSAKQASKQKKSSVVSVPPVTKNKPEQQDPNQRMELIKKAAEKSRLRKLAASNRAAFGGELGGGFIVPGGSFRRYSEGVDESHGHDCEPKPCVDKSKTTTDKVIAKRTKEILRGRGKWTFGDFNSEYDKFATDESKENRMRVMSPDSAVLPGKCCLTITPKKKIISKMVKSLKKAFMGKKTKLVERVGKDDWDDNDPPFDPDPPKKNKGITVGKRPEGMSRARHLARQALQDIYPTNRKILKKMNWEETEIDEASVKKGQKTASKEWAKHLRKQGKKEFWKKERKEGKKPLSEGGIKVGTFIGNGNNKSAKVYKHRKWDEYTVKHFQNGKHEKSYDTVVKHDAMNTAREWVGQSHVYEEANMSKSREEMINELKKSTLASYVKRASRDVRTITHFETDDETEAHAHLKIANDNHPNVMDIPAHKKSPYKQKKAEAAYNKYNAMAMDWRQRGKRRLAGISKAADKLAKEEVEPVNELHTDTLKSYAHKAIGDMKKQVIRKRNANLVFNPDRMPDGEIEAMNADAAYNKAAKTYDKRRAGVRVVAKKLGARGALPTQESVEQIDEISKDKAVATYVGRTVKQDKIYKEKGVFSPEAEKNADKAKNLYGRIKKKFGDKGVISARAEVARMMRGEETIADMAKAMYREKTRPVIQEAPEVQAPVVEAPVEQQTAAQTYLNIRTNLANNAKSK